MSLWLHKLFITVIELIIPQYNFDAYRPLVIQLYIQLLPIVVNHPIFFGSSQFIIHTASARQRCFRRVADVRPSMPRPTAIPGAKATLDGLVKWMVSQGGEANDFGRTHFGCSVWLVLTASLSPILDHLWKLRCQI